MCGLFYGPEFCKRGCGVSKCLTIGTIISQGRISQGLIYVPVLVQCFSSAAIC